MAACPDCGGEQQHRRGGGACLVAQVAQLRAEVARLLGRGMTDAPGPAPEVEAAPAPPDGAASDVPPTTEAPSGGVKRSEAAT